MKRVLILAVLVLLVIPSITTAFALDSAASLQIVLGQSYDQASQKITFLNSTQGVPEETASIYAHGLEEYHTALDLVVTDLVQAKTHAVSAMESFTKVIESVQSTQTQQDEIISLLEEITYTEDYANTITILASSNNVTASVSFDDYNAAIKGAKEALSREGITEARSQLVLAQGSLQDIYEQIQANAEQNRDERAKQFSEDTIAKIDTMIANAQKFGLTPQLTEELKNIKQHLEEVKTTDQIIGITEESSQLQNATDVYNEQRISNFDEEVLQLEQQITSLQSKAESLGLHLTAISSLTSLLEEIKQNIAVGQTEEASQQLDEADSMLINVNDVVNDAEPVLGEIEEQRNRSDTLQEQLMQQNMVSYLGYIDQVTQNLDWAASTIVNAQSTTDLEYARSYVDQARNLLDMIENDIASLSAINAQAQSILDDIEYLRQYAMMMDSQEPTHALDESQFYAEQALSMTSAGEIEQAQSYLDKANQQLEYAKTITIIPH